jgi:hypothetical protein
VDHRGRVCRRLELGELQPEPLERRLQGAELLAHGRRVAGRRWTAMAEEAADTPQRWTAKRRAALVLSIVKGETSIEAAAREFSLKRTYLTIQNDRL